VKKPFAVGDLVVSIRDMEMSNRASVLGYDERGFVLVRFEDGVPRAVPVASVERAADRKPRFRPQSKELAESANLGDYLARIESGILTKEKEK